LCASFKKQTFKKPSEAVKNKFSYPKCKTKPIGVGASKSKEETIFDGSNETLSNLTSFVNFLCSQFDDFGQQFASGIKQYHRTKNEKVL